MHATLTYPTLPVGRFFTRECVRGYRFGFNGQMKDDEVYGEGNSYTAEYWQYDPRLGRRWNIDPMFAAKPWMSPYHAFSNKPIVNIDPNGAHDGDYWRYNKDDKKMEHAGNDGIEDGKNYILHDNAPGGPVTSDNYYDDFHLKGVVSTYPNQNIRNDVNKQVMDLQGKVEPYPNIDGWTVNGTWFEKGGFVAQKDGVQTHIPSKPSDKFEPTSFSEKWVVEIDPLDPLDNVSTPENMIQQGYTIAFIYHIHNSGKVLPSSSQGGGMGAKQPRGNVWLQGPSEKDYSNAGPYSSYYEGVTVFQVSSESNRETVTFYNSGGNTISIPLKVFVAPLIK